MITLAARRGSESKSLNRETVSHPALFYAAQPLPAIPLDAYNLCVFYRHRPLEVAYTSVSLLYGTSSLFLNGVTLTLLVICTIRLPRVLVDCFPGGEVREAGAQNPNHPNDYG